MEEYLRLKDEFKIDDSHSKIRGFVVCKTEDGKVIFTKENMIVKDGRKLILQKLFSTSSSTINFRPVSGSEYKMTDPKDNISDSTALYKAFGNGDFNTAIGDRFERNITSEESLTDGQYYVNDTELYIHFRLRKEPGGSGSVTSSFGLVTETNNDPNSKSGCSLFSRVTFPSYPDSATLVFDYYIYF